MVRGKRRNGFKELHVRQDWTKMRESAVDVPLHLAMPSAFYHEHFYFSFNFQ